MDKLLLVDIGNSAVKWALTPLSESLAASYKKYPEEITAEFFINLWASIEIPNEIMVTCVATERAWQALIEASQRLWNIKAKRVFSAEIGYGLTNAYVNPSELGSDRWCAMVAAYHATDSDIIVIDCGSAITIDIVNSAGQHLGGYILPCRENQCI